MELAFSANTKTYLKEVFHDTKYQEETAEIIVPDSLPDAASVSFCHASVLLRDKECRNGSVLISGGVNAGAVYTPEDGSYTRLLEAYMPFTVRFDHADIADDTQIIAETTISSVDARMINSRKIMLRVNIACRITVYNTDAYTDYLLQSADERLQMKCRTLEICLPVEMAEKTFAVGDSFEVPSSRPPVEQICKFRNCCEIIDRKIVGNKAIFKGMLHCRILYRSEDNGFYTWSQQLPFSQYCELRNDYDEDILTVIPVVSGCDISLNRTDSADMIHITVNILAQCVVSTSQKTELIEDAYCVRGILQPEWSHQLLPCRLDQKQEQLQLHHSLRGNLNEIIDFDIYTGFPSCRKNAQTIEMSVPISVRVCGKDDAGQFAGLQGRDDLCVHYALDENAVCVMYLNSADGCMVQNTSDGVDVRCSVSANAVFYTMQELKSICGGTIEQPSQSENRSPSIILRKIEQEQPLWDVAKAYATTVDALKMSNGIDGEFTPGSGMLLIPAE